MDFLPNSRLIILIPQRLSLSVPVRSWLCFPKSPLRVHMNLAFLEIMDVFTLHSFHKHYRVGCNYLDSIFYCCFSFVLQHIGSVITMSVRLRQIQLTVPNVCWWSPHTLAAANKIEMKTKQIAACQFSCMSEFRKLLNIQVFQSKPRKLLGAGNSKLLLTFP